MTNPLGGSFTLDYTVQKTDFNNPNAKWAMSDVTVYDGYNKVEDGADAYKTHYIYENGKYDRRERSFYGYAKIKAIEYLTDQEPGQPAVPYRTTVSEYFNDSYFLNGLLKQSSTAKALMNLQIHRNTKFYNIKALDDSNNKLKTPQVDLPHDYDVGGKQGRHSAAVLLGRTVNHIYELDTNPIETMAEFIYDDRGRVVTYTNNQDVSTTADDYATTIVYYDDPALEAKNMISIPREMIVEKNGSALRKRQAEVDLNTGKILSIASSIDTQTESVTKMSYDNYGNLSGIEYPETSMSYNYQYDSQFHKYVVNIKDAYQYNSYATYDSNLDKVLETIDISGNAIHYQYDAFGRTTLIQGPKELALGKPYTLKFSYFPYLNTLPQGSGVNEELFMPVALTQHYDSGHPTNDIETYTFMDGLARPVQVKKDISFTIKPSDTQHYEAFSVSGKTTYDRFGRVVVQFLPTSEMRDDTTKFLYNEDINPASGLTVYDEVNRVTDTYNPGDQHTNNQYGLSTDDTGTKAMATTTQTEQNNSTAVITTTFHDAAGKVISTMHVGGASGEIWTHFNYDAIGQLLSYTDAGQLTTEYKYDLLGRKTEMQHPDSGKTSYYYDTASRLLKLQTANLEADASLDPEKRFIKYTYEFNRLVGIKYPDMPGGVDNLSNVNYKFGDSGNETGKVICQKDATGTQEFRYGNMGEVIYNKRTIAGPMMPVRTFETSFTYDSWNRLRTMTYPDGENVSYTYDLGGNLTKFQECGTAIVMITSR